MNEKISLPALVQLHALKTGDTKKQSEDFIKEFFGLISSSLVEGEQIKIKSLGVFKTVQVGARKSVSVSTGEESLIPAHRKVVFTPSKEIADRINEPFEMFETVEVNDNVEFSETDEILLTQDTSEMPSPTNENERDKSLKETANQDRTDNGDHHVVATDGVTTKIYSQSTEEKIKTPVSQSMPESSTTENAVAELRENYQPIDERSNEDSSAKEIKSESVENSNDPEETEIVENIEDNQSNDAPSKRFGIGFLSGFVCAVVICGIVFAIWYFVGQSTFDNPSGLTETQVNQLENKVENETNLNDLPVEDTPEPTQKVENDEQQVSENNVTATDTREEPEEVSTAPSDQKVYDTIGKTRYLTTMAKDHYGNYHLWPYIYMENKSFLGHPDRIKPGTKVVVPPLSKYNVNPKDPKEIAKAKKLGVQIYSKYR